MKGRNRKPLKNTAKPDPTASVHSPATSQDVAERSITPAAPCSHMVHTIGWLGGLMLATTLGACWGKAVLDVISLVRFATPTVGVVPGCAALGTVATLWWARQTAQGGKVVRMLQIMILWTLWMGIATGTMMYLASGRVIIEALELEDMQRLGTSHCIMALGVVILMFFTRRLLADESMDPLAAASNGAPGSAASGSADPAEPPPAGCGPTSKPKSPEVPIITSRQKKKQKKKAAAAARAALTEPLSSVPAKDSSPSSPTHLTPSPHLTPAPPSSPPLQRHSSGSTVNPSSPKQAKSPHLSTPPQSVTEPISRTSSHTPPRPPSQPVPQPNQIRSYRPNYATLPADSPLTFPGGNISTMRQTSDRHDTSAARYQKVRFHDRATSSPTTRQETRFHSTYDRQKTATSHYQSNDTMNGSSSSSAAHQMADLVSDIVRRAKHSKSSAPSPSFWAAVTTPLVGRKVDFGVLTERFPSGHARLTELNKLRSGSQPYNSYRSIRGDGECFYRAVLVSLVESLSAAAPNKKTQAFICRLTKLHESLPIWTRTPNVDYNFHLLVALLANVGKLPVADLVLVCQQQKESNCMVMFLRAVTAAGIMETGDEHLPVLQCLTDSEGASIEQICQNFVLPLAGPPAGDFFNPRQADQLHIQMLSEKLLLNLTLQNVSFKLSTMFISPVRCQNGFRINIELVFDGTHYELLYKQ
ncbi:OTU domain, ubiquitin aldehyde binding [Trebouxia sp. C0010 RCD-2024]